MEAQAVTQPFCLLWFTFMQALLAAGLKLLRSHQPSTDKDTVPLGPLKSNSEDKDVAVEKLALRRIPKMLEKLTAAYNSLLN